MPLSAGEKLGPYEIVSLLGKGGMGEVWKAHDPRLNRDVALKISAQQFTDRFEREARAIAALNHPNICTLFDIGPNYLVMELVEGPTLAERMAQAPIPVEEALRIAKQIGDALEAAHEKAIVHRDLKPANVKIRPDGSVKVLDFGLAKSGETVELTSDSPTMMPGTQIGMILGTAGYMSPEQARGQIVDKRADIWAFGVVLYEMVTGRKLFDGPTVSDSLAAILTKEPDLALAPEKTRRLLARCLEKDPRKRLRDIGEAPWLLEESGASVTASSATPTPVPPSRSRTLMLTAAAVIAGSLITLGALRLLPKNETPAPAAQTVIPLTGYAGNEAWPSFSPDGGQIAFTWDGEKQNNEDIYVKIVGNSGPPLRLTTDPAADLFAKWSPDGRNIAFLRSTGTDFAVMLISALGGPERRLATYRKNELAGLNWSPDGKWLAVAGASGGNTNPEAPKLWLLSVDTGESRVLLESPGGQIFDAHPAISPDGRSLAFVRVRGLNISDIMAVQLGENYQPKGTPRKVFADNQFNTEPAWTADGREIVYSGGGPGASQSVLYRIRADGSAPPVKILDNGVQPALSLSAHRLAFSRYFGNTNIWRFDTAAKNAGPEPFIASSGREAFPQYSGDGKRIVFYSDRGGTTQIWTCNADGSAPVQLTSMNGTITGTPHFSPDGQTISFDSNTGGVWQVYTVSANGGQPKQLTRDNSSNFDATWSRDGQWIYFTSQKTGSEQTWKMPAAGGVAVQVTRQGGELLEESPDGKWLYYVKLEGRTQGGALWRMPAGGGDESKVAEPVYRTNYHITDRGVWFTTPTTSRAPAEVRFLDLQTGKTTLIYRLTKPVDYGLTLSPDGRYVLFAQLDQSGSDLMMLENFR